MKRAQIELSRGIMDKIDRMPARYTGKELRDEIRMVSGQLLCQTLDLSWPNDGGNLSEVMLGVFRFMR